MASYKTFTQLVNTFDYHAEKAIAEGKSWWKYKQDNFLNCDHEFKTPYKWQLENGVMRVGLFCDACGYKYLNGVKKSDYDIETLPERDSDMVTVQDVREVDKVISLYVSDALLKLSGNAEDEFWQEYKKYLSSDKWKAKRKAVIKRDVICQACLSRPAKQAHHLTYSHVFDEPLFDLVGVCVPCHDKITAMDRERRGQ